MARVSVLLCHEPCMAKPAAITAAAASTSGAGVWLQMLQMLPGPLQLLCTQHLQAGAYICNLSICVSVAAHLQCAALPSTLQSVLPACTIPCTLHLGCPAPGWQSHHQCLGWAARWQHSTACSARNRVVTWQLRGLGAAAGYSTAYTMAANHACAVVS